MKNSINATLLIKLFIFNWLIILNYTYILSQENKYTRQNQHAPIITYSAEKCYSRSILVTDSFVYTANSNGTLFKTSHDGKTNINLMENKHFGEMRDLAFINNKLIGMQSATDGLLAFTDGNQFLNYYNMPGKTWMNVFLDGMDFYGSTGFIMGDPKNGYFSLFYSKDGGINWNECTGKVEALPGEAGFAGSGTNVQVLNDSTFVFVSGGVKNRFFISSDKGKTWRSSSVPYFGSQSCGAFSICMTDTLNGVIVGGDYSNPELKNNCAFYTDDSGKFWLNAESQPNGYRSCVIQANGVFYACGTTGIDFSTDGGIHWKAFALGNYFALDADKKYLYATMPNGKFQYFNLIH